MAEGADETRERYKHFQAIPTRWIDNDLYGHVNNVRYYEYFDTVINKYLIDAGGLDIHHGTVIGACEREAAVYALSQLRAAQAERQLVNA